MKRTITIYFLLLFGIISVPGTVSAETFLSRDNSKKTAASIPPKEEEEEVEIQKNINRMSRVTGAINALRGNINTVEGTIGQIEVRVKGLDPDSKDVILANTEIQEARTKLSDAKKLAKEAKDFARDMNPKNSDEVATVRSIIFSSTKSISESIFILKSTISRIKPLKIVHTEIIEKETN